MPYNIEYIRTILDQGYDDPEIIVFCNKHLREIANDVSSRGLFKSERIEKIIGHIQYNDGEIDRLYAVIRSERPGLTLSDVSGLPASLKVPIHLPYLCNRADQENDLEIALDKHRQHTHKRKYPFLCIVHGKENECHDTFIERISQDSDAYDLQRFYKVEKVDCESMPFPKVSSGAKDLDVRLRKQLENLFGSRPKSSLPMIICTYIDTMDWKLGGKKMVRSFIEFWNNNHEAYTDRLFIICLCVKYRGGIINWVSERRCKSFLQKLGNDDFSEFANIYGATLTELKGIEKQDAENWARLKVVQDWWKKGRQNLLDEISEIYSRHDSGGLLTKGSNCIPMTMLARELNEVFRK